MKPDESNGFIVKYQSNFADISHEPNARRAIQSFGPTRIPRYLELNTSPNDMLRLKRLKYCIPAYTPLMDMPRRKTSASISNVLASAENLRNTINALPTQVRDQTKELALAIVTQPAKRVGRPPGRPPKRRGRPPKRRGRPAKKPVGRPPKAVERPEV